MPLCLGQGSLGESLRGEFRDKGQEKELEGEFKLQRDDLMSLELLTPARKQGGGLPRPAVSRSFRTGGQEGVRGQRSCGEAVGHQRARVPGAWGKLRCWHSLGLGGLLDASQAGL